MDLFIQLFPRFIYYSAQEPVWNILLLKGVSQQVLYITVGATVESSVPLHYVHLSFSDDWFDNRK